MILSYGDRRAERFANGEAVRGDRVGQFSIRINLQWWICFHWPADVSGPLQVEITDYH